MIFVEHFPEVVIGTLQAPNHFTMLGEFSKNRMVQIHGLIFHICVHDLSFIGCDEGSSDDVKKQPGFEEPPKGREFEETDATAGVANRYPEDSRLFRSICGRTVARP